MAEKRRSLAPKIVNFRENESNHEKHRNSSPSREVIAAQRAQLPMHQGKREVVREIFSHEVTVIVGETGSGKSTQLPQAILEKDGSQNIVVTQPRRVAAMSLAARVSAEVGCKVGSTVGYNVRFDSKVSKDTRIRYVTDGMLLREFMLDPKLSRYTTVIVDEAHERTVTSDLVLGLLKLLRQERKSRKLRVVVMSATLDTARFFDFFGSAVTTKLYVPGRAFEVQRYFAKSPVASIVDASSQAILQINQSEPGGGDILVFLPGQDEIESVRDLLKNAKLQQNVPLLKICPLYAALPEKNQQEAFLPASLGSRKVILATNIAETSVTIPGVRYVVDSGLRKVRVHRSTLGLESLLPAPISQASAAQRMGRAGREGAGKCWRLYTEESYHSEMIPQTEPEISRVGLAYPILLLKRLGVSSVLDFPWIDTPSKSSVQNAVLHLYTLKALNKKLDITPFGLKMATLPLEPALAAVLVTAQETSSSKIREAILDVTACLSVPDLLVTPAASRREEVSERRHELFPASVQYGDLVLVKLIWDSYQDMGQQQHELKDWCHSIGVSARALKRVSQVRKQILSYLKATSNKAVSTGSKTGNGAATEMGFDDGDDDKFESGDYEQLIKAFLQGYVSNTAVAMPDRRFQTVMTQQPISIHPGSAMFGTKPEAIMYLEYVYTVRGYARLVSPVEVSWLREACPHLLARAYAPQQ